MKNGLFTVKRAYKLASNINRETPAAASTEPDGRRGIWKNVRKENLPNNVEIFSWRLARDNLATQKNKWRRNLEVKSKICGNGVEDSFHALVECTIAKAVEMHNEGFMRTS
jgi:hypothetical protein